MLSSPTGLGFEFCLHSISVPPFKHLYSHLLHYTWYDLVCLALQCLAFLTKMHHFLEVRITCMSIAYFGVWFVLYIWEPPLANLFLPLVFSIFLYCAGSHWKFSCLCCYQRCCTALHMDTSHSVWHHVIWIFSGTEQYFNQRDKLLPVFKHGFLRSKENAHINNIMYTKVYHKICIL